MNNCIGFYNHRYFILFCVFMWLGTLYVCFTSFDLFTYHFFHPGVSAFPEKSTSINLVQNFQMKIVIIYQELKMLLISENLAGMVPITKD